MSEQKHWCQYCKIFVQNNHSSIQNHETGWNHKRNASKFIEGKNREKRNEEREKNQIQKEIRHIQKLGEKSFNKKDSSNIDNKISQQQQSTPNILEKRGTESNNNNNISFVGKPNWKDNNNNNTTSDTNNKRKHGDMEDDIKKFSELSEKEKLYIQKRMLDAQLKKLNGEEDDEDESDDEENNEDENEENNDESNDEETNENDGVVGQWESIDPSESAFGDSVTTYTDEYSNNDNNSGYQEDDSYNYNPITKKLKLEQVDNNDNNEEVKEEVEDDEPVIIKKKSNNNNNNKRHIRKVVYEDKQG